MRLSNRPLILPPYTPSAARSRCILSTSGPESPWRRTGAFDGDAEPVAERPGLGVVGGAAGAAAVDGADAVGDGDADFDAFGDAEREADLVGAAEGEADSAGLVGRTLAAGAEGFASRRTVSLSTERDIMPIASATVPTATTVPVPASTVGNRRRREPPPVRFPLGPPPPPPPPPVSRWVCGCASRPRSWTCAGGTGGRGAVSAGQYACGGVSGHTGMP
ncbi:hypothetical protein GCM10009731_49450 [Streptomyces globosus]